MRIQVIQPNGTPVFKKVLTGSFWSWTTHKFHDWVIQVETAIETDGTIIIAKAKYWLKKPVAASTAAVADPAPHTIKGPRNSANGDRIPKAIARTHGLVGTIAVRISLKLAVTLTATALNIAKNSNMMIKVAMSEIDF